MPPLQPYHQALPYSYALGTYPSLQLMEAMPEKARRLLLRQEAQGEGIQKLREVCARQGVREEVADRALSRISGKQNCFAALVFEKWEASLQQDAPHVVLHHPMDEGNLGTIQRTLLGFGIRDIAIIRPAADPFAPHVVRASMGALFRLRVQEFEDFSLYRQAYPIHSLYPFMLDGALALEAAAREQKRPYALVFGNEGKGLPREFARMGQPVRIPHSGEIDSLNVAVAVAIGAYAFVQAPPKEDPA